MSCHWSEIYEIYRKTKSRQVAFPGFVHVETPTWLQTKGNLEFSKNLESPAKNEIFGKIDWSQWTKAKLGCLILMIVKGAMEFKWLLRIMISLVSYPGTVLPKDRLLLASFVFLLFPLKKLIIAETK